MSLVKRVAGFALAMLPEGIRGRLLPGEYRYSVRDLPAPLEAPDTPTRVLIAPANFAGQGWFWARALERHLEGVGARNLMERTAVDFRHPADVVVPRGVYAVSSRWSRTTEARVVAGFTHVLVEAEKRPFGAVLRETTEAQVRRLLRAGVRVGMIAHGSDVRLPSRHLAEEPDSPFADALASRAAELERIATENAELVRRLRLPTFVSTPGLLRDLPDAEWLPVVVDPIRWSGGRPVLERDRPMVVHVPSSAGVKGSDRVDPVLRGLEAEGLIEYRRAEAVPFERMPDLYRDADIVLDQFRLGDYGVAACEAMAAGRVVVGHVDERIRRFVHECVGAELPIVEATTASLAEVVRGLVADRARARDVAGRAAAFASIVHDGARSAEVMRGFLDG